MIRVKAVIDLDLNEEQARAWLRRLNQAMSEPGLMDPVVETDFVLTLEEDSPQKISLISELEGNKRKGLPS